MLAMEYIIVLTRQIQKDDKKLESCKRAAKNNQVILRFRWSMVIGNTMG